MSPICNFKRFQQKLRDQVDRLSMMRSVRLMHFFWRTILQDNWDKIFKNGPRKICGRHPLKSLKEYGLL